MRKIVKMLTSKILLSGLFLLIQLLFIAFVFKQLLEDEHVGVYLHFVFVVLAVIIVLHISSSDINPEYKIAWLIPIVAIPVFGAFIYLFYHQNNVKPKKRQKYLKEISKRQQYLESIPNNLKYKEITYLNKNGWRYYRNSKTKFLNSGEEKLENLLKDLKLANDFILLEYYIIAKGLMFDSILKILKDKAKDGVKVYLMYDDFGSADRMPFNFRMKMAKCNITAIPFNRMKLHINFAMNYRTHRKIVVIDGKIAYTGGVNIGDEYINVTKKLGHWQDSALRIEGEAVKSLTLTFLENWNFSSKTKLDFNDFIISNKLESDEVVAPFADNPIEDKQIARSMFLYLIAEAKEEILITSPYLILDNEIQTALKLASKAGVKIKIVIPKKPDKRSVYLVTEYYAYQLLTSGVEIYKYDPGFIHSKLFVIDSKKAIIGTSNLDFRSLYLNFENNIYLYNSNTINDITKYINDAIKISTLMTEETLKKTNIITRTVQAVLKGFSPLL